MDANLTATFDACGTFNSKLKDTLQGLIGANNDRKSEIDALRGDHDTLRKDHDSFVTSAERENEMSDQRNGSDDQQDLEQSRRISGQGMERPQQFKTPIIQYRAVSTPQVNQTLVTQKASFINESLELSSITVLSSFSELSSLRNGSQVDHDSIPNVSGFCNPPIRDLSEEEEAVLPARSGRPIREKGDSTSDDMEESSWSGSSWNKGGTGSEWENGQASSWNTAPLSPKSLITQRKKRKRESNEDLLKETIARNSELQQQIAEQERTIDDLQKELATTKERIIKLNTQKFECEESENKRISNLRSKMAEKVADMKELLQDES